MTAYNDLKDSISRTPVTLVVMTLDFCGRTFGSSPCLATGEPCYNTFPTCKYKSAYLKQSKDYKFTSLGAALPFKTGERPYLSKVSYMPTEIKETLTVNARVKCEFEDEPDTDVGIDPYVSQRSSVQGTYWKKLLARNPNYKARQVEIYEGFLGLAEADFQQRFIGNIDNITLGKSGVTVEVVDLLKSLATIDIPPKLDIKLTAEATASQTTLVLSAVTGLGNPSGYVRIGDEIIYYTGVNTSTNELTGCTRGYLGTTAAVHGVKDKVQKVRYYAPANPFDILKEMLLTDAGMEAGYVDSAAFDSWRDWPAGEPNFSAIVSEPEKLEKLYFEILGLIDCKSWVGEDLKITIRRNVPNQPGRSYHSLTDEANIVHGSLSVDLNQKSRLTRITLFWDKNSTGKIDDMKEYNRIDIALDADAENANEYGDVAEKKVFCRWLRKDYMDEDVLARYIKNLILRLVRRQRDALPIATFAVELKDSHIKTGEYASLTTGALQKKDGNDVSGEKYQVVKRDFKGKALTLSLMKLSQRRVLILGPSSLPSYTAATEVQKEYGFLCSSDAKMSDGSEGFYIW